MVNVCYTHEFFCRKTEGNNCIHCYRTALIGLLDLIRFAEEFDKEKLDLRVEIIKKGLIDINRVDIENIKYLFNYNIDFDWIDRIVSQIKEGNINKNKLEIEVNSVLRRVKRFFPPKYSETFP